MKVWTWFELGATNRLNYWFMAKAELYSAEYIGSGTFIISKPGRKKKKLRQSRVKSPQRGARK